MQPTVCKPCFLFGAVNEETTESLVKTLWGYALEDERDGPISLMISSEGGDVPLGWSIIETVREIRNSCGAIVNTHVIGECSSIAIPIFLSATGERIASRSSSFFIHNLQVDGASGKPSEMARLATALEWMNDSLYEFILKRTELSPSMLKGMMDKDVHFTGEQALEMGFATQIR